MLGIFSACCVMGAFSNQSPLEFEQGGQLWREQIYLPFIEDLPSSILYSLSCMQTALYMYFLCGSDYNPHFSGNETEFQEGYMTCLMSYHLQVTGFEPYSKPILCTEQAASHQT